MLILTAGRPKKAIWGFLRLIPYLIEMGSVLFFSDLVLVLSFSVSVLIPYLIGMGSVLVLCPIAGVAEGFRASWELTHVRLLSRVRSQVGLQVLQTTVRLPAALELKERRRLVRLCALRQGATSTGWEEVIIGGGTPRTTSQPRTKPSSDNAPTGLLRLFRESINFESGPVDFTSHARF